MLDRRPNTASYVEVLGPNEMWVSGTFQRFIDGLIKVPSRNSIIRSETVNILVQLAVVLVATGTALGAAELVGSTSARTNAPVYAFVVVFACLITVSGQLQRVLYSLRDRYYPQLDIRSSPRERITFNVMSLIVTTGAGWALKKLLDFIFG